MGGVGDGMREGSVVVEEEEEAARRHRQRPRPPRRRPVAAVRETDADPDTVLLDARLVPVFGASVAVLRG